MPRHVPEVAVAAVPGTAAEHVVLAARALLHALASVTTMFLTTGVYILPEI